MPKLFFKKFLKVQTSSRDISKTDLIKTRNTLHELAQFQFYIHDKLEQQN
jgi:hypothetical protein